MFSVTADYALRATLLLARHHGEAPLHADEIADAIGAPRNYLAKTLNTLAKRGIVKSARGPRGGFSLAVSPASLSVAQIVAAFEEPRVASKCLLGRVPCDPNAPCVAHAQWTAVAHTVSDALSATSVASLLVHSA